MITTYDSLGTPHDLTFLFRKTATANEWDYRVLANSGEITGGTAGELQQVNPAGGKLAFNTDGSLDLTAPTNTSVGNIGSVAWADGAQAQTISAANLHFVGSTQFSLPSSVTTLTQDGNQSGTVTGIKIGLTVWLPACSARSSGAAL